MKNCTCTSHSHICTCLLLTEKWERGRGAPQRIKILLSQRSGCQNGFLATAQHICRQRPVGAMLRRVAQMVHRPFSLGFEKTRLTDTSIVTNVITFGWTLLETSDKHMPSHTNIHRQTKGWVDEQLNADVYYACRRNVVQDEEFKLTVWALQLKNNACSCLENSKRNWGTLTRHKKGYFSYEGKGNWHFLLLLSLSPTLHILLRFCLPSSGFCAILIIPSSLVTWKSAVCEKCWY